MLGLPSQNEVVRILYGLEYGFCCGYVGLSLLVIVLYLPSTNATFTSYLVSEALNCAKSFLTVDRHLLEIWTPIAKFVHNFIINDNADDSQPL